MASVVDDLGKIVGRLYEDQAGPEQERSDDQDLDNGDAAHKNEDGVVDTGNESQMASDVIQQDLTEGSPFGQHSPDASHMDENISEPKPSPAACPDLTSAHLYPRGTHSELQAGDKHELVDCDLGSESKADDQTQQEIARFGVSNLNNTPDSGIVPAACTQSTVAHTGELSSAQDQEQDPDLCWIQRLEQLATTEGGPSNLSQHAVHVYGQLSASKPVRRIYQTRAPPSSPPGPTSIESLSMPTLPALYNSSIPELLEKYKVERAAAPAAFDEKTRTIQEALIQAKLARGGSAKLLHNEYTAELASRLDAAMISGWELDVDRELQYGDSDFDGENYDSSFDRGLAVLGVGTFTKTDAQDESPNNPHFMPTGDFSADHTSNVSSSDSYHTQQGERVEAGADEDKKFKRKVSIGVNEDFSSLCEDHNSAYDTAVTVGQEKVEAAEAKSNKNRECLTGITTIRNQSPEQIDSPYLNDDSLPIDIRKGLDVLWKLTKLTKLHKGTTWDPKLLQLVTQVDERLGQLNENAE